MPQLIYPTRRDGLFVDVLVGVDGATTTGLLAAGQPVPSPIRARGVIDTGRDVTVVSAAILRRLGVPVQFQANTQTVSGPLAVNLYEVSLGITDFGTPGAPELVEADLLVMELVSALPTLDVLIGLDVLLGCKFLVDGPAGQFSLEF